MGTTSHPEKVIMDLEDVARKAKVSTATVSRVLNNVDVVRPETRDRVLRVIKALNYHPNLHARSLAGGKSQTIGMIVSNLANPFFLDIFRTLETTANRQGYEILVANTNYNRDQLVRNVHLMIGRRVAGLAVIVSEMEPSLIEELEKTKLPVVFYSVGTPKGHIANIRIHYRKGIQRIVEYLRDLGHKRIAFIGHHVALEPLNSRKHAFLEVMHNSPSSIEYTTLAASDSPQGGRQATATLFESGFNPSAIVCINDFMAVGVLRELQNRGLSVPEDVSVTGFDNIRLSEYTCPALTTADIPRSKIGNLIFSYLSLDTNSTPLVGAETIIEPELIVRESTGPFCPKRTGTIDPKTGRSRLKGKNRTAMARSENCMVTVKGSTTPSSGQPDFL